MHRDRPGAGRLPVDVGSDVARPPCIQRARRHSAIDRQRPSLRRCVRVRVGGYGRVPRTSGRRLGRRRGSVSPCPSEARRRPARHRAACAGAVCSPVQVRRHGCFDAEAGVPMPREDRPVDVPCHHRSTLRSNSGGAASLHVEGGPAGLSHGRRRWPCASSTSRPNRRGSPIDGADRPRGCSRDGTAAVSLQGPAAKAAKPRAYAADNRNEGEFVGNRHGSAACAGTSPLPAPNTSCATA
jgi:hypothetical protein